VRVSVSVRVLTFDLRDRRPRYWHVGSTGHYEGQGHRSEFKVTAGNVARVLAATSTERFLVYVYRYFCLSAGSLTRTWIDFREIIGLCKYWYWQRRAGVGERHAIPQDSVGG